MYDKFNNMDASASAYDHRPTYSGPYDGSVSLLVWADFDNTSENPGAYGAITLTLKEDAVSGKIYVCRSSRDSGEGC